MTFTFPPRVVEDERDGVIGVRVRHQGSSWFLPCDDAVQLAFRIANCVERIRANN